MDSHIMLFFFATFMKLQMSKKYYKML